MPGHPLDDRDFVFRNDPKGIYALTEAFPDQCRKALQIARGSCPALPVEEPDALVLSGLGGSAAGGDFVRAIVEQEGSVPFFVNRDYTLPNFVGPTTVLFGSSYSGNTEETLSSYAHARQRGAKIVVVTSGGKIAELAKADSVPCIRIPGGQPPRTAMGFMLVPVLYCCEKWGLVSAQPYDAAFGLLEKCISDWGFDAPFEKNPAKKLAQALHGGVGIFYGLGSWQGAVAYRWKGQVCENAKNLCFSHAFPELNHNEILGWMGARNQGVKRWVVMILEDGKESEKMKARARVTSELLSGIAEVHRAQARGQSLLERMLSLTFLGDFVSIYLAALNEVDPEGIEWIDKLKSELAKVPG